MKERCLLFESVVNSCFIDRHRCKVTHLIVKVKTIFKQFIQPFFQSTKQCKIMQLCVILPSIYLLYSNHLFTEHFNYNSKQINVQEQERKVILYAIFSIHPSIFFICMVNLQCTSRLLLTFLTMYSYVSKVLSFHSVFKVFIQSCSLLCFKLKRNF